MKRKLFPVFLSLLVLFFAAELLYSRFVLTVSSYALQVQAFDTDLRIVQLTDLHNRSFGKNQVRLVKKVRALAPDIIVLTGDFNDSATENVDAVLTLIEQLAQICPVYASLGNHELEAMEAYGMDIVSLYEEAGAIVLEQSFTEVTVNGQALRIGGIYGYCLPKLYLETGEAREEECAFLADFQDTDAYTILLCHMPVCWILNGSLDAWDIDLVLSGHVHGGEVRLPFVGGLYAPDFGWFSGRLWGLYDGETSDSVLILSTGLATTELVPRLFNPPELVVVELQKAEK